MNKFTKAVHSFLSDEGFRPKYVEDNIIFKYEGDTYVMFFDDDKDDYSSINKFITGVDFSDDYILDIYKIVNKINSDVIIG